MIIDFHAHIGKGPAGKASILQKDISPEKILRYAKEAGVNKTVVFPVSYSEYSAANREIFEAIKKYPNRVIGFCRIAPRNERAMDNFEIAVNEYGLKGLKLHPGCDSMSILGEEVARLIKRCGQLRIPVIFDCVPRPGRVDSLVELAQRFPQTNIVFAHMGMGGFFDLEAMEKCISTAGRLKNVFLDTAMVDLLPILEDAIKRVPDKILLGSDSPAMHPKVNIEMIRVLRLEKTVEEKILGKNAEKLLLP